MNIDQILSDLRGFHSVYGRKLGIEYLLFLAEHRNIEFSYMFMGMIVGKRHDRVEMIPCSSISKSDYRTVREVRRRLSVIYLELLKGKCMEVLELEKQQLLEYLSQVQRDGELLHFRGELAQVKKAVKEAIYQAMTEMRTRDRPNYERICRILYKTRHTISIKI